MYSRYLHLIVQGLTMIFMLRILILYMFGWSNHWTRRSSENDDNTSPGGEENTNNIYGGFSETQAESQVVSYEEDLSGRQMIIDSFRTKSGLNANPSLTRHGIDREKGSMHAIKVQKNII